MVLPHLKKGQVVTNLLSYLELFAHIPLGQSWVLRMQNGLVVSENNQAFTADTPYEGGLHIYYYRHIPDEPRVPFEAQIVYQDAHLLVADKPHFLPVSPTGRYVQETLLVRLKRASGLDDLVPIHRIDRDTAGLVMFSVQPSSRNAYAALFREHAVEKSYEAIAPYCAALDFPRIHRSRLVPGDSFMQMQEVPSPAHLANSETHIALLEHNAAQGLYSLQPITGKRHQLRVHMMALGIPITGDHIYPVMHPEPDTAALDYSQPLQLLAKKIAFTDPVTGCAHTFVSQRKLGGFRL